MLFTNPIFIIYSVLAIAILLLTFWIIRLELRIKTILGGKNAKTLEDALTHIYQELKDGKKFRQESSEYLQDVEHRLRRSIQGVETIRFNPFKGTGSGGNHSFSTAFVTEEGKGVVISGIYARDSVGIYSKPVEAFTSSYTLFSEEGEVLKNIQKKVQKERKTTSK